MFKAVRQVVPDEVPITVKLRWAWDDTEAMTAAFHEVFNAIYDMGAAWATVHCRTVEQRYKVPVDGHSSLNFEPNIPIGCFLVPVTFGPLKTCLRCLTSRGDRGLGGPGLRGNPWIFRQCRQMMAGHSADEPTLSS